MEEASKGMKEPSAVQFKDATVQPSGHRDALMHERNQALGCGVNRSQEEGRPDKRSIHELSENHSPINIPSKKYRSSESNPPGLQMPKIVLHMPTNESDKLMPAKFSTIDEACKVERKIVAGPSMDHSEDGKIVLHKLFEKSLTPSDVGKLNRFVVPKKHAVEYFPDVKNTDKVVLLEFLDNENKRWKFRYSYWTSSQSFVLTKGWYQFVREKRLDEKDVVVFYQFEEEKDGQKNQHYMIGIKPFDKGSNKLILREHTDEMTKNQISEYSLETTEKIMEEEKMEEISKKILTRGRKGVEETAEKSSTGEQEVMKVEDQDREKMSSTRRYERVEEAAEKSLTGEQKVMKLKDQDSDKMGSTRRHKRVEEAAEKGSTGEQEEMKAEDPDRDRMSSTRRHEGVEEAAEKSLTREKEVMNVEDQDRDKMSLIRSHEINLEENSLERKEGAEVTDMEQETSKEGVWLFGVQISP